MNGRLLAPFLLPLLAGSSAPAQYFQQRIHYTLIVTLNDRSHELDGRAEILYINNSPTPLGEIYFHLWPNAYRDNTSALVSQQLENKNTELFNAGEKDRGYMNGLQFTADGSPVRVKYDSLHPDICKLELNKILMPGDSLLISTPFHVKIPSVRFSRMGHEGRNYFISQWYPKPAVYDRQGWHPMPYLDQGEFYSEFGSFEVSITLPSDYVVGSTGDRLTESDIRFMDDRAALPQTEKYAIRNEERSETAMKTVSFRQENVHDFAWCASPGFRVEKGEVELPSGKKVITWVLHSGSDAPRWSKVIDYQNRALLDYSRWIGEYPYSHCTVVEGPVAAGGGMEYPCITIISNPSSDFELEDITAHEVGHNWFYGILGSNERDYPWMDEGINSFYELRYMEKRISEDRLPNLKDAYGLGEFGKLIWSDDFGYRDSWVLQYLLTARTRNDQAITLEAPDFTPLNYGVDLYAKTGLALNYLKSYLGEALFDSCMRHYFETWKFRHPYPGDLQDVFKTVTGKDLGWFFSGMLATTGKADYALTSVKPMARSDSGAQPVLEVELKNRGRLTPPVTLTGIRNDTVAFTRWLEGFDHTVSVPVADCDRLRIDHEGLLPEINRRNNSIRTRGFLKKWELPRFRLFGGMESADRPTAFFIPAAGWNNYNKAMAGFALYNSFIPNRDFEYAFVPMFAPRSQSLTGTGTLSYTWYPSKSPVHHVELSAGLKHYAKDYAKILAVDQDAVFWYYTAQPAAVRVVFRKKTARSSKKSFLQMQNVNTWQDESVYDGTGVQKTNNFRSYQLLTYSHTNSRTFDPYSVQAAVERGEGFVKATAEGVYALSYSNPARELSIRWTAGVFLKHDTDNPTFNLRLSGDPGYYDYRYEQSFFGRNETSGVLSQQMAPGGGGFKVLSAIGSSDEWITSVNILADFPGKLPFAFFADAGTFSGAWDQEAPYQKIAYDAGLVIRLIKNAAEIYIPLVKSSDISDALEANGKEFKDQVRFLLNIKLLNPIGWRDRALKD